jgi:hypothetical protein
VSPAEQDRFQLPGRPLLHPGQHVGVAVEPVCLWCAGWAGSQQGTRVAALFDSLIESPKLAGVEPRACLGEAARRAIRSLGAVTLARDLKFPET